MPGNTWSKGDPGDKGGPGIDGNIFLIKAKSGEPLEPIYYIWIEIINSVLNNTEWGDKGEPGPQVRFYRYLQLTLSHVGLTSGTGSTLG